MFEFLSSFILSKSRHSFEEHAGEFVNPPISTGNDQKIRAQIRGGTLAETLQVLDGYATHGCSRP